MRIALAVTLTACYPYNEPAPDHYRDQVSSEIFKLEGQDETWLLQRIRSEEYLGRRIPNLLQYDWDDNRLAVWWVDNQPCPYKPERNAIVDGLGRCFAGQTWGCPEIYVATNQREPEHVCGTALAHEYGHCMRSAAGLSSDGAHKNSDFWNNHLPAVSRELCMRAGATSERIEEQQQIDLELAAGYCEHK